MAETASLEQIRQLLQQFGCPEEKLDYMAGQLDKRAKQLAERPGQTYESALAHLVSMMQQGWAAKERGFS